MNTWRIGVTEINPLLGFLVLTLLTGVIYKVKFAKKKDPGLRKPDWKKDVVYLCQFYLVPSVRTISPFALKLETWLRMSGNSDFEDLELPVEH